MTEKKYNYGSWGSCRDGKATWKIPKFRSFRNKNFIIASPPFCFDGSRIYYELLILFGYPEADPDHLPYKLPVYVITHKPIESDDKCYIMYLKLEIINKSSSSSCKWEGDIRLSKKHPYNGCDGIACISALMDKSQGYIMDDGSISIVFNAHVLYATCKQQQGEEETGYTGGIELTLQDFDCYNQFSGGAINVRCPCFKVLTRSYLRLRVCETSVGQLSVFLEFPNDEYYGGLQDVLGFFRVTVYRQVGRRRRGQEHIGQDEHIIEQKWGRIENEIPLEFENFMSVSTLKESKGYLVNNCLKMALSFHAIEESYPAIVDQKHLSWKIESILKLNKFLKKNFIKNLIKKKPVFLESKSFRAADDLPPFRFVINPGGGSLGFYLKSSGACDLRCLFRIGEGKKHLEGHCAENEMFGFAEFFMLSHLYSGGYLVENALEVHAEVDKKLLEVGYAEVEKSFEEAGKPLELLDSAVEKETNDSDKLFSMYTFLQKIVEKVETHHMEINKTSLPEALNNLKLMDDARDDLLKAIYLCGFPRAEAEEAILEEDVGIQKAEDVARGQCSLWLAKIKEMNQNKKILISQLEAMNRENNFLLDCLKSTSSLDPIGLVGDDQFIEELEERFKNVT